MNVMKEDRGMVNKHVNVSSTPLLINKMQIKTLRRYNFTLIKVSKIGKIDKSKYWQGGRTPGTSHTVDGIFE